MVKASLNISQETWFLISVVYIFYFKFVILKIFCKRKS